MSEITDAIADFLKRHTGDAPRFSLITPTSTIQSFSLAQTALALLKQSTTLWEWLIVDNAPDSDVLQHLSPELRQLPNIHILLLPSSESLSAALNEGLRLSRAPFCCSVFGGDLLAPQALERLLDQHNAGCDVVYSDSVTLDEAGSSGQPFHKPAWSPELLRALMYVGHLFSFTRTVASKAGGFNPRFDGIQNFEFLLRLSEISSNFGHVPAVLYHSGAVAFDSAALQREAVQSHLTRVGLKALALTTGHPGQIHIHPAIRTSFPKISIILPTKDEPEILRTCLYSIFAKTSYPNFEVICVDNQTTEPRALEEMQLAPVTRVVLNGRFNYSTANHLGAQYASGEYLLFLNNDTEVLTNDWLENLLYYAAQSDVGAVGALLLYPNKTVQHAGVVIGCEGTANHLLRHASPHVHQYAASLTCAHEVSGVTAACMLMRKSLFEELDGFNAHFFTHYQDVDLCLRLRQRNYRIIMTPHAQLYHHESITRGTYYDLIDRGLLRDLWEPVLAAGDPYYNPNLDLQKCDYSLAAPPTSYAR